MSFVVPHRVDDRAISGFYEKVSTEGDNANLVSEAPGREALVGVLSGVYNSGEKSMTYELPFSYLVGRSQLFVSWEANDYGQSPAKFTGYQRLLSIEVAQQSLAFDSTAHPYYREISPTKVEVYNLEALTPRPFINNDPNQNQTSASPGRVNSLFFSVPHTAKPATDESKVIVENQGDNVGIELKGQGDGILFTSTGGKSALLRINDFGTLVTDPLS